jgi:peptide/nickel transport system permease protein
VFARRRIVSVIVILVLLVTVVFAIVRLIPGDPGVRIGGTQSTRAEQIAINHRLGVDRPLVTQYVDYWSDLLHGDLGTSFTTGDPVTTVISQNAGHSLQIAVLALLLVLLTSVPIGIAVGALTRDQRHRRIETWFSGTTSVVGSLPELLVATLLVYAFALKLGLFPVGGTEGWKTLILPVIAVSLRPIAILMRMVRIETLACLSTDYVRTARSKRLPNRILYVRHVLPNVITAALTIGGLLFAELIAGLVIIEAIFARPGLGTTLVNSVLARDYPVIQGMVLVLGVTVVVANGLVDILLAALDPRQTSR